MMSGAAFAARFCRCPVKSCGSGVETEMARGRVASSRNQRETVRLLSRSTMWTISPAWAKAPAKQATVVDLPTPPFEDAQVIIMQEPINTGVHKTRNLELQLTMLMVIRED